MFSTPSVLILRAIQTRFVTTLIDQFTKSYHSSCCSVNHPHQLQEEQLQEEQLRGPSSHPPVQLSPTLNRSSHKTRFDRSLRTRFVQWWLQETSHLLDLLQSGQIPLAQLGLGQGEQPGEQLEGQQGGRHHHPLYSRQTLRHYRGRVSSRWEEGFAQIQTSLLVSHKSCSLRTV